MNQLYRIPAARGEPSVTLAQVLARSGLTPGLAAELERISHKLVEADPRRPLREPGHPRSEVMFVQSGLLCKYKAEPGGRRQIVALRFAGEGILPHAGSADYGLQAVTRSRVLVGRGEEFFAIADRNPELVRYLRTIQQRQQAISDEWLVNCGRRDTTARVAHLLCETATRIGLDVEREALSNPFTQQQIADITGQTSVNVNRVFAELERKGLIRRSGRAITFADWPEMRRVAGFQPAYLD